MSATPRIHVDVPLEEGRRVPLPDEAAHYLLRVMRLEQGDGVIAFDGRSGDYAATIVVESRSRAALDVGMRTRAFVASPDVWLLFSPLKKTRTDFLIEKATELGASRILPVLTRRSDTQRVRPDRLERLVIEAAEQTERHDVPQVGEPSSLPTALQDWSAARPLYFCDEEAGAGTEPAPMMRDELARAPAESAAILIGPEGGFDPSERQLLRGLPFVRAVSLGPRILRAETAAVAALTLWQAHCGDWRAPG